RMDSRADSRVDRTLAEAIVADVTVAAADEPSRVYYRARVHLGTPLDQPVPPQPAAAGQADRLGVLAPYPASGADAYPAPLFHGPIFQTITEIEGMDSNGARAVLRPSAPSSCVRAPRTEDRTEGWILDPVLLDGALQMQLLWARAHWDLTVLPTELGQLRRYAVPVPRGGTGLVRHELRIRPGARPPLCRADHYLYDADGRLLASITDIV